jgi:Xaa-Pro aminopeptidase
MEHVHLNSNEHVRAVIEVETRESRFITDLQRRYPLHHYCRLARLMHELRVVKTPGEVALMRQACAITRLGFMRVLSELSPGMNECDVEALYAYEFTRNRGFFAYNPIVASGMSACTLHYNRNDQVCRDGDLLLLDVAASYANYNADLTRTIPVNGRYTPRQRQVYDAVLRIQRTMIANAKPGVLWRDWQRAAEDLATNELAGLGLLKGTSLSRDSAGRSPCKPYFMHGVGHPIGLDVHDVGHLKTPFAVGWALTVEPGIYIPEEGMGIRIEDIIVITDEGQTNLMAETPKEPDEIEALLAQRPS